MFGRRPNSNQARISVLGFSANRVRLVIRFFNFSIYFYFILLHFNLINIQYRMDSLHNLPFGTAGRQIMWANVRQCCRTDSLHNLPSGKLCRLSVRHYCRTASYVGYPSGSCAGRIAYITCCPAAGRIATA